MNNPLQITFTDNTKAVYHVTVGSKIKEVLAEIEAETNKTILTFEWLFNKQ